MSFLCGLLAGAFLAVAVLAYAGRKLNPKGRPGPDDDVLCHEDVVVRKNRNERIEVH